MKKLLVIISLVLVTSNVLAASVEQFCSDLKWADGRIDCLNKVKNSFFDENALDVCLSISPFDDARLACLDLIANKTYEPFMIKMCSEETFASDKEKCLREVGTIVSTGSDTHYDNLIIKMKEIQKLSSNAKMAIRQNNIRAALIFIDKISRLSSRNSGRIVENGGMRDR